jgi:galactonate dehydratase
MQYYTFATVSEDTVAKVIGRNAPEVMWDDTLGAGLQMALFDAVGRATDTPVWALLGRKHRDRAFISWWDIDMSGEDWLLECKQALSEGYTDFKTKGRPWWDLDEQCRTLCSELPDWFNVDMDFNGMLVDAGRASTLLTQIEKYSHVKIYESPIPQGDVAGNKFVRSKTRVAIAHHFGTPPIMTALQEDVCDGFVIGGGATRVMRDGTVSAAAEKPFFLQLVGTGITATWALHFGAVLTHARWPSVNCHQLYTTHVVQPRLEVFNGTAAIPNGPGLGVELERRDRELPPAGNAREAVPAPGPAHRYPVRQRRRQLLHPHHAVLGRLPLRPPPRLPGRHPYRDHPERRHPRLARPPDPRPAGRRALRLGRFLTAKTPRGKRRGIIHHKGTKTPRRKDL